MECSNWLNPVISLQLWWLKATLCSQRVRLLESKVCNGVGGRKLTWQVIMNPSLAPKHANMCIHIHTAQCSSLSLFFSTPLCNVSSAPLSGLVACTPFYWSIHQCLWNRGSEHSENIQRLRRWFKIIIVKMSNVLGDTWWLCIMTAPLIWILLLQCLSSVTLRRSKLEASHSMSFMNTYYFHNYSTSVLIPLVTLLTIFEIDFSWV